MVELTSKNLKVVVFPEREGMLSPIGHDLAIVATQIKGSLDGDTIVVEFDPKGLSVLGNVSGGRIDESTPGDKDKRKIEDNMLSDVLETKRHTAIRFEGSREGSRVTGKLSLHGVTKDVSADVVDGVCRFVLHQPDYNITPYKAFLGQLRIKADVRVEVTLMT